MAWILALGLLAQEETEIRKAAEKLTSSDPTERLAGEEFLRKAGAKAVMVLVGILQNEHGGMRDQVAELVRTLADRDWKKRDGAMRALVALGRHALKALQEHENASDPEVAWRVRAAIAKIQEQAAQDEKEELALQAAVARILGELDDARAVPALLSGLGSRSLDLRRAAAQAGATLRKHLTSDQADVAAEAALELYSNPALVQQRAGLLRDLAALRSPLAVKPLTQLLRDRSERNSSLKRNAMATLVAIGTPEARRAVIQSLEDEDPYVRQGAFRLLEGAAGEGFGFDPRLSAGENREALSRFRDWWERSSGAKW